MARYELDFATGEFESLVGGLADDDIVKVGDDSDGSRTGIALVSEFTAKAPNTAVQISNVPPANMDPGAITVQLAVDDLQLQIDSVGTIGASNYIAGVADPGPSDGDNGDFWLNTTTGDVWGPKAAGVWPGLPNGNAYSQTPLSTTAPVQLTSTTTATVGVSTEAMRADATFAYDNFANTNLQILGPRDIDVNGNNLTFSNASGIYVDATVAFDVLAPKLKLTAPTTVGASIELCDGGSTPITISAPDTATAHRLILPATPGDPDDVLTINSGAASDRFLAWSKSKNFAHDDLTFEEDRTHVGEGNMLRVEDLSSFQIQATGGAFFQVPTVSIASTTGIYPTVRLMDGLRYADITVPTLASSWRWILPDGLPTVGQILRVTNVNGIDVTFEYRDPCTAGYIELTAAAAVASGLTYDDGKPFYIDSLTQAETLPVVTGLPNGQVQSIYIRGGAFDWSLTNYQFGPHDDGTPRTITQSTSNTKVDRIDIIRRGSGSTVNVDLIFDAEWSPGLTHLDPEA